MNKKKFGKAPVIVFDYVNRLAAENPAILKILQEGAKDTTDHCICISKTNSSD